MIHLYLKEDGSLDVERISKLPLEESLHVIAKMTTEQMDEYFSHFPPVDPNEPFEPATLNCTVEDLLARGCATQEQIMNRIKEICEEK